MSLLKLWFFAMLTAIVGFAAVGRLNRRINQLDPPQLRTRLHGSGLVADGSIWHGSDQALRTKSEMRSTGFLAAQFNSAKGLAAGKLLVASRDLADPNFVETVVLLVRYDAQGVVGLVLNRRTNVPLSRLFKGLKAAEDRSDPVYLGGPVETPAVFSLFQSSAKIDGAERIFEGVYLISSKTLFEQTISTKPDPGVFHVYLGYAGWNRDQLRKEVELGAWFILPADTSAIFNSDPDSLWPQMIRKTELKFVWSVPATEPWTASRAPFSGVARVYLGEMPEGPHHLKAWVF